MTPKVLLEKRRRIVVEICAFADKLEDPAGAGA